MIQITNKMFLQFVCMNLFAFELLREKTNNFEFPTRSDINQLYRQRLEA